MTPFFSHQDCVIMGQNMLFTAAGLFQCLIISIMNGKSGLAFKFIVYNDHHKLTYSLRWGPIWFMTPFFWHQDCVILEQDMLFIAAGLFHCLIISIMNGQSGLAFKFIVYNGHHKLTYSLRWGPNCHARSKVRRWRVLPHVIFRMITYCVIMWIWFVSFFTK